jgi:hypothetical protein
MNDYYRKLFRGILGSALELAPYKSIAKERGMSEQEEDALRHYWLVDFAGKDFADKREVNTEKTGSILDPIFTSNNDPKDLWNNMIAKQHQEQSRGLLPFESINEAASLIQGRQRMRKPQFPFITWN